MITTQNPLKSPLLLINPKGPTTRILIIKLGVIAYRKLYINEVILAGFLCTVFLQIWWRWYGNLMLPVGMIDSFCGYMWCLQQRPITSQGTEAKWQQAECLALNGTHKLQSLSQGSGIITWERGQKESRSPRRWITTWKHYPLDTRGKLIECQNLC